MTNVPVLDLEWWVKTGVKNQGGWTLSTALVPALLATAVVDKAFPSSATGVVRELGRPTAEVVFVVGLGIQAHETTVAAPANARERVVWVLSVLLHVAVMVFYVDVDVTPLGVGVAFGVFATGLLAYGVGGSFSSSLKWPYKMSPLACAVFVACALVQRLV